MKIALVCPASLPATQFGGILFLCVDIARESSNYGHDVTIYTTDLGFANNPKTFNKNLPRVETIDNFKIKRSHVWLASHLFFVNPGIYFQMMKDCPDIIHTIGVRSFQSYIAAIVAKKKKIPLVISDQGGLTTHPELREGSALKRFLYKLQTPMIKYIVNQASKIIVANEYEKQIFLSKEIGLKEQAMTPNNESKIIVVRNGINLEISNQKTTDFRRKYSINKKFFLFVGRFAKVKGLDILLQAMNSIKNQPELENMQLVIMGVDFGFESEMIHMIKSLKLDGKITVIKNPLREDVITAYQESEFLVLPSRWELSPLTPLEGFVFKKPVISTVAHGIPSTITDGENGILVESENYAELGQAILELSRDESKRVKFGLAGYDLVQKECNSIKMVKDTLEIYKKIING